MTILAGIKCLVANCGGIVAARGLCSKHYKQQQRHGAPSEEVSAKLIDGKKFKDHALYQTWRSISRVALGTAICDEWKDFEQFVKDVGTKPEDARSLRRVDTTKPYSKTNAYWHTTAVWPDDKKAQAKNHQRAFRAANPDYARWMSIKSKYGLTKEQYEALLARQSGVCAVCEKPEMRTTKTGQTMNLHIDHCHKTKIVRGLLCSRCNTAIGFLNDDLGTLAKAVEYLKTYKDV